MAAYFTRSEPFCDPEIGADKPLNLYIATEFYQGGGHRMLLDRLVASRPDERHLVVLTGARTENLAYSMEWIEEVGAFPVGPDVDAPLYDRLIRLRRRLGAYAARRVFLLHHPEDVLATTAAYELQPRYGKRLYVVRHSDTRPTLGAELFEATHIAIRPEHKQMVQADCPDISCFDLPLAHSSNKASARLLDKPSDFSSGAFVTATAGGDHKFCGTGQLSLAKIITGLLRATRGRHVHFGAISKKLRAAIEAELEEVGIPASRCAFPGDVRSLSAGLIEANVNFFVASFPIGGGLSVTEAASTGTPVAVFCPEDDAAKRYQSGATHRPPVSLEWTEPEELFGFLRREEELFTFAPDARTKGALGAMAQSSVDWYESQLSPGKFKSRLGAIIAASEGRAVKTVAAAIDDVPDQIVNADFYLKYNEDVRADGMDPREHYAAFGVREKRNPCPLFSESYYLAQLSSGERKIARKSPLAHYLARGETRGLRPHPLFDPDMVAASSALSRDGEESSTLAAYLANPDASIRTHTFFDAAHYLRGQGNVAIRFGSPLADFLEAGALVGKAPHPLIDMERFGSDPLEAFLSYVSEKPKKKSEVSTHPLFDPRHFGKGREKRAYSFAPNLLWEYLVEGNTRGADPHLLVSVDHVANMQPSILLERRSLIESMATNGFEGDSHPLLSFEHIRQQAPWIATMGKNVTIYFLERCVLDSIDPCPFFSTGYYFFHNPDIAGSKLNPLEHYLLHGQFEGRSPHPAFDGNYYFSAFMREGFQGQNGPLVDFCSVGAGFYRHCQPMDRNDVVVNRKMAGRLLQLGDDTGASELLKASIHPLDAHQHPTLMCEVRDLTTAFPVEAEAWIAPAHVKVARPSVIHPHLIAPASGEYDVDGARAGMIESATLIGGNDGVILPDGRWFDPGMRHFDPERMELKQGGAVAEVDHDLRRVLLRWNGFGAELSAGIFASGTYSQNYFHFLIEILPRILAADRIAPEDTPLLIDRSMPPQHVQVLRLLFPNRKVRSLRRGVSYKVGTLYLGDMCNSVSDVLVADTAPVDGVRYNPQMLKNLAGLAKRFTSESDPKKLFLRRESDIRTLINSSAIEEDLVERGFEAVTCERLSFAEQVLMVSRADVIVGQSGAQMANILFARPGTRVYVLYSNAPGTNYYLWSEIGRILGLEVVNVAGWSIPGTAPAPGKARVHEAFSVPAEHLLPFFPLVDEEGEAVLPDDLRGCLQALYAANGEADTLTGAWTLSASPTPAGFEDRLARLRARAGTLLDQAEEDEIGDILSEPFFADFGRNIRSGFQALRDYSGDEAVLSARVREDYLKWAEGASDYTDDEAELERLVALAMIYLPVWELPLPADMSGVSDRLFGRLLNWFTAPPFLFRDGEDAAYVIYAEALLTWLDRQLDLAESDAISALLLRTVTSIDLGQLFLIDRPLRGLSQARNRLLERLTPADTSVRSVPRQPGGQDGRIRIGILCRTFDKGPDSEAVVSFFRGFDKTRYEIFAYSIGFRDRVVSANRAFDIEFDKVIDHRRTVAGETVSMRRAILADDLDIFLHANATSYGVHAQEMALYRRVAPIQMVLNSHVPMPFGFASFDGYLTGQSDEAEFEVDQDNYDETLVRVRGPVICYLSSFDAPRQPLFDRAAIGIADDAVVMMNAGSLSKLRHGCLRAMMEAVKAVPSAVLMLAPFNPGWVARSQAFAFNRVLAEMCAETGLSPERVVVLGELSKAEAESALALADIYLNPFPHGGATMTHLALINGKPPVTLRRRSTRSIDQFLIDSIGVSEILADTEEDYIAIAHQLGEDQAFRTQLSERIRTAAQSAPFVNNIEYSLSMQAAIDQVLNAFEADT